MTFRQAAERYIAENRKGWKNAVHAAQWPATLETYAYPEIGERPVAAIDTAAVLRCISPLWTVKAETASRLRGRIERVIDAARVAGDTLEAGFELPCLNHACDPTSKVMNAMFGG